MLASNQTTPVKLDVKIGTGILAKVDFTSDGASDLTALQPKGRGI